MRLIIIAVGATALMMLAATAIMTAGATGECVAAGAVGGLLDLLPQARTSRCSDAGASPADASAPGMATSGGTRRDATGPSAGVSGLIDRLIAPATQR